MAKTKDSFVVKYLLTVQAAAVAETGESYLADSACCICIK